MITYITGVPGSGKSAALVKLLLELSKTRAIYVDGIPELKVPHQVLQDPMKWMDLPDGSVVVIDEVQRIWPAAGAGQRVPEAIKELAVHRHRGFDFFIVSQNPKQIHVNVRALVGRHVHLRNIGVLGRWWYEWPECQSAPETAWKTAPVKTRYRLPKKHLALYRSATEHTKVPRKIPPVVFVLIFAVLAVGVLGWFVAGSIRERTAGDKPKPATATALPSSSSGFALPGLSGGRGDSSAALWPQYYSEPVNPAREPLAGMAVVFEGEVWASGKPELYFGLHLDGRRVTTIRLAQLLASGYAWASLGPCMGLLTFRQVERVVTCGAPTPLAANIDPPSSAQASPVPQSPLPSGIPGVQPGKGGQS